MPTAVKRALKVFLCHASGDKPAVRDLYKRLVTEGVDAWLDQEKLLPGQDWRMEIPRAVREADVVVICLSKNSITKEGYVQKEIRFALDIAEEKPEGTIFLIPARLEDCMVPERLNRWQWVDLFDENGLIKLLRSLKLRADAVDATVEPASYVDVDEELDHRLEQLYTEGLAAFYTEDWDKACQRFQAILSERPERKNAAEKLEEAKRRRNLAKLYEQAADAVRSENWEIAIQTLEELSQKSADYKDTTQLLRNARKQKQLRALYSEARTLHAAQKWEAVVKVFEQISAIDPVYPDTDGLLPYAQKEVAEIKRIAGLNELYSRALDEMDAGNWHEARRLLERVHKAQTGFLETEVLLRKIEDEIAKIEENNKRANQVNMLYEQAHGLLRSKKWRNVLEKLEQIRRLDDHFQDPDRIGKKAQSGLAREEQETERQDRLAALYAEAVRLLKEEKYQDALDKWQEVKATEPKYPDRQGVQNAARKKLTESTMSFRAKPWISKRRVVWIMSVVIIMLVIIGIYFVFFYKYKPGCASIQSCQQLAEKAVERNDPELALIYFNLAIEMVPSNLKPQYSGLWHDRADVLEQLEHLAEAENDRDIWWLYNMDVQKIIFSSERDGNPEIYVMDVTGDKVVRLTFDPSDDWGPVWSPDGSTIAFTSDRSGNEEVFLMDADGSNVRNLTNNLAVDSFPSWSPDGTKIAFSTNRLDGSSDIFMMNADGSNPTCLVYDDADDWGPTWSPDGKQIAYSTDAFDNQEIIIVNADGSDLRNPFRNAAEDFFASWSPDGKRITFTSTRNDNVPGIFISNLESYYAYSLYQISSIRGWGSKWSPDGNLIVFASNDNDEGDNEIVLYDLRTQELSFLTNNTANDNLPSWSPLP